MAGVSGPRPAVSDVDNDADGCDAHIGTLHDAAVVGAGAARNSLLWLPGVPDGGVPQAFVDGARDSLLLRA